MHRRCQLGPASSLEPMAALPSGPTVGSLAEPLTEPMVGLMAPFPGVTPEFVWNSTCVRVGKLYHPFEDGTVASEDTCVCVRVSRHVARCMLQMCAHFQTVRKQRRTLSEMAHQVTRMRVYACVLVRRPLYVPILHSTTKKSTEGTGPDAAAGRLEMVREDRRGSREG